MTFNVFYRRHWETIKEAVKVRMQHLRISYTLVNLDGVMSAIGDTLEGHFYDRTILGTEDKTRLIMVNIIADRLPEFMAAIEKYQHWDDYIDKAQFGTSSVSESLNVEGAQPLNTADTDPSIFNDVIAYEKNQEKTKTTTNDMQATIRGMANSYFWKLGLYERFLPIFEPLFKGFEIHGY